MFPDWPALSVLPGSSAFPLTLFLYLQPNGAISYHGWSTPGAPSFITGQQTESLTAYKSTGPCGVLHTLETLLLSTLFTFIIYWAMLKELLNTGYKHMISFYLKLCPHVDWKCLLFSWTTCVAINIVVKSGGFSAVFCCERKGLYKATEKWHGSEGGLLVHIGTYFHYFVAPAVVNCVELLW